MSANKSAKPVASIKKHKVRKLLIAYDILFLAMSAILNLVVYHGDGSGKIDAVPFDSVVAHSVLAFVCILVARFAFKVYFQVWRYGGIQAYIRLLVSDTVAFVVYYPIEKAAFEPMGFTAISFPRALAFICVSLLLALASRMLYRYVYKYLDTSTKFGKFLLKVLAIIGAKTIHPDNGKVQKIKIAIIGAGRTGTGLAEELFSNASSFYIPRCFIDISSGKIGRDIYGIPVLNEDEATPLMLKKLEVQEIVFALPKIDASKMKKLYEYYASLGYKVKSYDYPTIENAGTGRRQLKDFAIEELLFRQQISVTDDRAVNYYQGKKVLVTGGGGSIGSELSRQIAKMEPEQLILLDVYENCAYDIQQELRMKYGKALDLHVEILSVCNRAALERVFDYYRPDIVLHAAAHKHVPLMEHNCVEAVENNVFGTLNVVECAEKYGCGRFIMISTDKAVNPTNVMGATKRMCEMIVLSHSNTGSGTVFSATRFGNVLGSAGSVIPLFRKQIANGGPITITDKRIIRYFMTIPEASQLVLQSGVLAKNGELFVLDMGKPVKIFDLAENMIKLSGMQPGRDIEIIETGLRPGEKLYEELLIKSEDLDKTDNDLIFIERDKPLSVEEIEEKLSILAAAVKTGSDEEVRQALHTVVPTFHTPEEVNEAGVKNG